MDIETVRAKMIEQVDAARASAMARAFRWTIDVDGTTVYVKVGPRKKTDLDYLLRVNFDDFPRRAPSYIFVDKGSKQHVSSAWPPGVRHGGDQDPPGICTPGTREFHERLHANDAQYPWNPTSNTFLDTLQMICRMMEKGMGL